MQHQVSVSSAFRKNTLKAIAAIVFFIIVFLVLIAAAFALTLFSGYIGIMIIAASPSFLTLLLGGGLVTMGILVLVFVLRFVTATHKIDYSGMQEITREEQPALFSLIDDVVREAETSAPKKVFLTHDVNASVFYNSSFWSMLLPVRKNLQIGLGLINVVTVSEFKAIMAHEFGHFSQRTMKVGSYVYHVNQILYHLLFNNDSFARMAQSVASIHAVIGIFVMISFRIVNGVQWILKKMYTVVNGSYMALSREMEFHADEVAAAIAGSDPLIHSLQRLDLANYAYSSVIDHYNQRIGEAVVTNNIYPQQIQVMQFLAKENQIPMVEGLPQAHLNDRQYNQSKLVVKDPWASHPPIADRSERLKKLNIVRTDQNNAPARSILQHADEVETSFTEQLFSSVSYEKTTVVQDTQAFIDLFEKKFVQLKIHPLYNEYYNGYNLPAYSPDDLGMVVVEQNVTAFFTDEKRQQLSLLQAAEADLANIKTIAAGETAITSFEYDGVKYKASDAKNLITGIESAIIRLKERVAENDRSIVNWFLNKSKELHLETEWRSFYQSFLEVDRDWEREIELYKKMVDGFSFIYETHSYETIVQKLSSMRTTEEEVKKDIKKLIAIEENKTQMQPDSIQKLEKYCSAEWVYFNQPEYKMDAIRVMELAREEYFKLVQLNYTRIRNGLLEFQAEKLNVPSILPVN